MKTIFLAASLAVLTAGCASTQTVPIYKNQNVVTLLPKSYTGHCVVRTTPPNKQAFVKASKDERIQMLLDEAAALLVDIKTCNDRWDQVDIWNASQLAIYGNDPTAIYPGQGPATPQGASAAAPAH